MTIALFVEGPSDKKTLRILVRRILGKGAAKTKIVCRIVRQGGLFNARKIKAYVRDDVLLRHQNVDNIIAVVDSECNPCEETQSEAAKIERQLKRLKVKPLPRYCVACHALEAWLGADLEALKQVAGKPVKLTENLFQACRPKEVLRRAFEKLDKPFNHVKDDPRIAEKIDPAKVAKNNPSFAHFVRLVKGR